MTVLQGKGTKYYDNLLDGTIDTDKWTVVGTVNELNYGLEGTYSTATKSVVTKIDLLTLGSKFLVSWGGGTNGNHVVGGSASLLVNATTVLSCATGVDATTRPSGHGGTVLIEFTAPNTINIKRVVPSESLTVGYISKVSLAEDTDIVGTTLSITASGSGGGGNGFSLSRIEILE